MDRQQHDAFVLELLDIEKSFDELDISDLELSDDEVLAIEDMIPDQTIQDVGDIIEAYQPMSEMDIRLMLVMKLLGLLATKADKQLRKAFTIGWESP